MLFRKRDPDAHLISHVFALYFQNLIFQIPVPLHIDDMRFAGETIPLLFAPPLSSSIKHCAASQKNGMYRMYDLSSKEIKKDETINMNFGFDLAILQSIGLDKDNVGKIVEINLSRKRNL